MLFSVGEKYTLTIPDFLNKTNDLNEDASLQYEHLRKELYVLVIDENKKELYDILEENELVDTYAKSLEGFTKLFLDGFEGDPNFPDVPDASDEQINGLPAKIITMDGKAEDVDIHYKIALVEGKDDFYQIMTWTIKSMKAEHSTDMDDLLRSFVEK